MRLFVAINLIFSFAIGFVSADPWLCGTPLLHQQHLGQHPPEEVAAAPAAPVQIGHVERLFIHIPETEVTATCIAKSEHLYVYVDNSVRELFTDADAVAVAREFDTRIYPGVRKWMGTEWKPGTRQRQPHHLADARCRYEQLWGGLWRLFRARRSGADSTE